MDCSSLRLSLRRRMALSFGALVAMLLLLAASALWQMRELSQQLSRIVEIHNALVAPDEPAAAPGTRPAPDACAPMTPEPLSGAV